MRIFSSITRGILGAIALGSLQVAPFAYAGTLSCTVATSCASGTVLFRLQSTQNAHGELPSESAYSQLVCCSGVVGLGEDCSGTYAELANFSSTTNAHVEENTFANYAHTACISVPMGGSVSVGYQSGSCTGFDTTIASMSGDTNAHIGDASAYTDKICASALGASGTLAVDIVDAVGATVVSPAFAMEAVAFSFTHQSVVGDFGGLGQSIRVQNTTANPLWTLTLSPTAGSAATWSAGSVQYDFNDPTASVLDGGDADTYGGQMIIDPSAGILTPQSGCSTLGLSLGSATAFSEGVADSVTLLTSGASTQTGCYWDVTGLEISQSLPAEQPVANYAIDMTLTITAN